MPLQQHNSFFYQANPQSGSSNDSSRVSAPSLLTDLARSNVEALIKAGASQAHNAAVVDVVYVVHDNE